jgi:hypothetical protein
LSVVRPSETLSSIMLSNEQKCFLALDRFLHNCTMSKDMVGDLVSKSPFSLHFIN